MAMTYELRRPDPQGSVAPSLDPDQQAVVDHPGGPLLVLAGPGTGKTTTLVETVVRRIVHGGLSPEQVLVLTFSRKAAESLRTRIGRRLERTTAAPMATTFHSLCYALVRRFQDADAFEHPLQLLSAPEQDSRIQDLLAGTRETQKVDWPDALHAALRTKGLAAELQQLMSRARVLGMGPADLRAVGERAGREDWRAAGEFFAEYLDVFDAQNLMDYAELVHRAVVLARTPTHQRRLRDEIRLVVVDEYQDSDPLQVELLDALCGGGRDLVAVGDPDQSIYAFRGADVRGLLEFPTRFPTAAGAPAPTIALRRTRRFGPAILAASRVVVAQSGVGGHLAADTFAAFRDPQPADPPYGDGEVCVRTYSSAAAEAENIALQLRRAHLDEGLAWSQMAVLVRSGVTSLPRLQRALVAAGVPVEVAGDEVPLHSSPAVTALLDVLRAVERLADEGTVAPDAARDLLTGPVGNVDPTALRGLSRELRRLDALVDPETSRPTRLARSSEELLAEALVEPALLAQVERGHAADAAHRAGVLARLLGQARDRYARRASPEEILWGLWHDSGWDARLRGAARGGGDQARSADRDLDAMCALFDLAARAQERQQRRGLTAFVAEVEAQQIPADTLSERGVRGDAVRLLTAHRAKGLQWRLVVVAGVQEGVWPDVRRRGTLFQAERLSWDGPLPASSVAALLAEERRLFYVAVTRAMQRLIVTAVESPAEDGDQPSRFVQELRSHLEDRGIATPPSRGRPDRPLSLRGAVAELRAIAESTDSDAVRRAAVDRLARLAASDTAVTACADPQRWWGVRDPTENARPVRPPDEPLDLSGSSLDGLVRCPLSWFLSHEAKGETASTTAQGFGLLVHALAADVVRGTSRDDPAELVRHLDEVWQRLGFAAPWISEREYEEAKEAIGRFVAWHRADETRTPLAAEHRFEVTVPVGGEQVRLRGSMDRVEVDSGGLVHVVDLKTGRNAVPGEKLRTHAQLGVYQLAVEHGAVDALAGMHARSGGAELVQLRLEASPTSPGLPKVQPQDPPVPGEQFVTVGQLMAATRTVREEDFRATPGADTCAFCPFHRVCPAQPEGRTILPAEDHSDRERP